MRRQQVERFIPQYDDEEDEPRYARLRSDPEWIAVSTLLRSGYWHVTSLQGWELIRASGAIKPNLGGQFDRRFGDISEKSYGFKNKLIALFDFPTPSEKEVMRQRGNAWDVLASTSSDQILLQLDRDSLSPRIVPNSAAWNRPDRQVLGGCIPHVEVWFPDDIPIEAITCCYRVPATSKFEFKPVLLHSFVHRDSP